jgi:hypothetical protein
MMLRRWWPRHRRTGAASLCVKRRASRHRATATVASYRGVCAKRLAKFARMFSTALDS